MGKTTAREVPERLKVVKQLATRASYTHSHRVMALAIEHLVAVIAELNLRLSVLEARSFERESPDLREWTS